MGKMCSEIPINKTNRKSLLDDREGKTFGKGEGPCFHDTTERILTY